MSRRIDAGQRGRTGVTIGDWVSDDRSSDIDSVHRVGSPVLKKCESPLCAVQFEPGGLPISPRRFCSDDCRQAVSILRRAGELLKGESDDRVLAVIRGRP